MAFDFPSSPTVGQTFSPSGGPSYTWTGSVWVPAGLVIISDTAPSNPTQGQLWWQSSTGKFWISYNDGTSTQWVSASTPGPQGAAIGPKCFSAHKNGVNQTGIANAVWTKVTFTSTFFNDAGCGYDAAASRWTPPAGKISLMALVYCDTLAGGNSLMAIYKNGSSYRQVMAPLGAGVNAWEWMLSLIDTASGTDYYEVYVAVNTGTTSNVSGSTALTNFAGMVL